MQSTVTRDHHSSWIDDPGYGATPVRKPRKKSTIKKGRLFAFLIFVAAAIVCGVMTHRTDPARISLYWMVGMLVAIICALVAFFGSGKSRRR